MSLELTSLRVGKSRKLGNDVIVRRGEDLFFMNGREYSLSDIIKVLYPSKKIDKKSSEENIATILVEPPARIISYHFIDDDKKMNELRLMARIRGLLIYFAKTKEINGKTYAQQPWMFDYHTLQDEEDTFSYKADEYSCPLCEKSFTSMSGFTQHIKSIHATYYIKTSKEAKTKLDDSDSNDFKCPYCDKILNSSFGKTNHIRSKHPEKIK